MNWIDTRLCKFAWWRKWRGIPDPRATSITLQMVQQECTRILHERCSFLKAMNREFPWDEPADGATIKVRRPNKYVSGTK